MREIKFRAWHKKWSPQEVDKTDWHTPGQKINGMQFVKGIWISNSGLKWVDMYPINDPCREFNRDTQIQLKDFRSTVRLEEVELMQYTCLKDKNGVEIYEGDIVKIKIIDEREEFKSVIDFYLGKFRENYYGYDIPTSSHDSIEIIGNIYEHPNLLTLP